MTPKKQDKLDNLHKKILLAKESNQGHLSSVKAHKNANYAWRMVLELVIGMILGFGIGYGLDNWLKTTPIMMITMSIFGFGAGIRTMMKTAAEFSPRKEIEEE